MQRLRKSSQGNNYNVNPWSFLFKNDNNDDDSDKKYFKVFKKYTVEKW